MTLASRKLAVPSAASAQSYPFTLPDLPYAYDALEPHIDQKTLQIHHREHHGAYVKKLNEALAKAPQIQGLTLAQLLRDLDRVPESIRTAVKNNGGGHLNHDFFWNSLTPAPTKAPQGALAQDLQKQFGSIDEFRKKFSEAAGKHFASGWVALAQDHATQNLEIVDLKDHQVLGEAKTGLLILDVWEHAYYLKHQNRRPEFIDAFWHVANWTQAAENFEQATRR